MEGAPEARCSWGAACYFRYFFGVEEPELTPRLAAVLARGSAPFAAAAVPGLLCDPYGLLEQPAAAASLAARLPLFADWLPLFAA